MVDDTPGKAKTHAQTTKECSRCVKHYFKCKSFEKKTRIAFMQTFDKTVHCSSNKVSKLTEGTANKNLYNKSEDRETYCSRNTICTPEG